MNVLCVYFLWVTCYVGIQYYSITNFPPTDHTLMTSIVINSWSWITIQATLKSSVVIFINNVKSFADVTF